MNKSLYDCFSHWYHEGKGQVYLYSDPHFGDTEMKHLRTNYIGDDEQVKRINSKMGKYDTIVFLGDIGDVNFIKRIRGYKVLIQGNHDSGAANYRRHITKVLLEGQIIQCDDNHLFDEVYEGILIIGPKLILSHEPINFEYGLNIHGHDHSKLYMKDDKHLNICAEHIDYTPICLKTIIQSGMLKNIPDIHRTVIDTATERKLKRKNKAKSMTNCRSLLN